MTTMCTESFYQINNAYNEITKWQVGIYKSMEGAQNFLEKDCKIRVIPSQLLASCSTDLVGSGLIGLLTVAKSVALIAEPLIKGVGALFYGAITLDKSLTLQGVKSIGLAITINLAKAVYTTGREIISLAKGAIPIISPLFKAGSTKFIDMFLEQKNTNARSNIKKYPNLHKTWITYTNTLISLNKIIPLNLNTTLNTTLNTEIKDRKPIKDTEDLTTNKLSFCYKQNDHNTSVSEDSNENVSDKDR